MGRVPNNAAYAVSAYLDHALVEWMAGNRESPVVTEREVAMHLGVAGTVSGPLAVREALQGLEESGTARRVSAGGQWQSRFGEE